MPRKKKEVIITPKDFRDNKDTERFAKMIGERLTGLNSVTNQPNKFILLTPKAGVGKTFITIHSMGLLPGGQNAHFMIFGPKAKVLDLSWEASIEGYNNVKGTQMTYTTNTLDFIKNHPDIVANIIDEHVANGQPIVVVLDEVHLAKNPTSKIGKAIAKLSLNENVSAMIGLSATPYSNSYMDTVGYLVWNQYYKNKTDFIKQQIKFFDDYRQPMVKDNQGNIDRTLFNDPDAIDKYLSEFTVDDQLDKSPLPPASFEERTFDLNNDKSIKYVDPAFIEFGEDRPRTQRGNYNAVKNKFYRDGYYESATKATAVEREMIANITQRAQILIDILTEIRYSTDPHPVLIFYQNNSELEAIQQIISNEPKLQPTKINIVNGKQKDLEDVDDPHTVVLIQYKAGGAAIEFPHAYSSIYYMPTYSYENYEQTLGRNRRNGMTHPVKYYKIIANNTLDDYVWHTILANKKSFSYATMKKVMSLSTASDEDI